MTGPLEVHKVTAVVQVSPEVLADQFDVWESLEAYRHRREAMTPEERERHDAEMDAERQARDAARDAERCPHCQCHPDEHGGC